jgi:flagellar protein FliO/FliZ
MMWSYILKLVVLLPLVCGLLIGSLYLWRKLEARLPGNQGDRMLKVRETMMVSTGTRIAVLEVEGKRLLVSVSRNGVTLIDRIDG